MYYRGRHDTCVYHGLSNTCVYYGELPHDTCLYHDGVGDIARQVS